MAAYIRKELCFSAQTHTRTQCFFFCKLRIGSLNEEEKHLYDYRLLCILNAFNLYTPYWPFAYTYTRNNVMNALTYTNTQKLNWVSVFSCSVAFSSTKKKSKVSFSFSFFAFSRRCENVRWVWEMYCCWWVLTQITHSHTHFLFGEKRSKYKRV